MVSTLAPALSFPRRVEVRRPTVVSRILQPDVLLGVLVSVIGTVIVAYGIGRFPATGGDEGIYTSQAWAVLHGELSPYTYTYDHPFGGWVQLAALSWLVQAVHIGGTLSVVNVRVIMVGYAFAQLMLTYGISRRLGIRPALSALSVLLLGLSPLFIVDARQVFLDNIAMPWVLGAIYLALNPSRKQWTYGLAGVFMAVGILSKETVLLFLPAVLYLVYVRAYRPIRVMSLAAFVTFGSLLVLVYPLFALLRSEFFPGSSHVSLWTNGVMYQLATRKGSGALWQAHSARRALLSGWVFYDHWLLYAGACAAVVCVALSRYRVLGLCFVLWALPVIKPGGYLPAMYVVAALPFAAMAVGAVLDSCQTGLTKCRVPSRIASVAIAVVVGVGLVGVVPSYLQGDRRVTTSHSAQAVVSQTAALKYLESHTQQQDNILTDDVFWTDLVRAGYGQPWHGAISYYKFDLDPAAGYSQNLPHGWEQINYILATPAMRSNVGYLGLTKTNQALVHSVVVATFGSGDGQVQVRKVQTTTYNNHGG